MFFVKIMSPLYEAWGAELPKLTAPRPRIIHVRPAGPHSPIYNPNWVGLKCEFEFLLRLCASVSGPEIVDV
jgi:hypothetical protein